MTDLTPTERQKLQDWAAEVVETMSDPDIQKTNWGKFKDVGKALQRYEEALIALEAREKRLTEALQSIAHSQELRWMTHSTGVNSTYSSLRRLSGAECAKRAREVLETT